MSGIEELKKLPDLLEPLTDEQIRNYLGHLGSTVVRFVSGGRRYEALLEYVKPEPGESGPLKGLALRVAPCPRCRSVSGWRRLLFWRVLHRRRCGQVKLWELIKRRNLFGFSVGGTCRSPGEESKDE